MKDNFLKASSFIFAGIMLGNAFNYLFQVTMGRVLEIQTFGEMNALFSMMVILGVPFASITNFMAKNTANYSALSLNKQANTLIVKSYKFILMVGFFIFILGAFFSGYISNYLKINNTMPVILLFFSIFLSAILPINNGVLQGMHNFRLLSFVAAGSGVIRYIVCVFLVLLGMGLNGIMIGTIITIALIGYISFMPIGRHLKIGMEPVNLNENGISSIIPILLANLAFALFAQSDIILVKYYFSPHEAGIYSSAAIIGKTVMYLPGAIVISLLPMAAFSKARDEGTLHLILKALAITVLLSGSGAAILYLFPDLIVSIFFGKKFISATSLIGLFAVAMMPLAVIMVIMNYNIAKGGRYFAYCMLAGSAVQVFGIMHFHDSLEKVLKVILYSGMFSMTVLFSLLAIEYYRGRLQMLGLFVKPTK